MEPILWMRTSRPGEKDWCWEEVEISVWDCRSADCKASTAKRIRKSNETGCGRVFRQIPLGMEVKGVSGPEFQTRPAIPPPT